MKAVVFTIDAVFALIVAGVGITVLLYFIYTPPIPFLISYSNTQSVLDAVLSLKVYQLVSGSGVAEQMVHQGVGSGSWWDQYRGDAMRNGSAAIGPIAASLAYSFNSIGQISAGPVAAYGDLYFAVGGTVDAINGTYSILDWSKSIGTTPISLALHNNLLYYSNAVGIAALNAYTGQAAWSSQPLAAAPSTPLLMYDGYAIFGTAGKAVDAYFAENGVQGWSTALSFTPVYLSAVNGSIVAGSSSGLALLTGSGSVIWSMQPSNSLTTDISTLNNLIAYGSQDYACALATNSIQAFCTSLDSAVTGVAVANGNLIYQTVGSIYAISASGSVLWSKTVPYGASAGYPVAAGSSVYSSWGDYLLSQNSITGKMQWNNSVPYGSVSNALLSYGRLYAVSGDRVILAYGACAGSPQSSVLSTAESLYANLDGSCADALLYSAYGNLNYSAALNSSVRPYQLLPNFNGQSSYIETGTGASAQVLTHFTLTAWINFTSLNNMVIESSYPANQHMLALESGSDCQNTQNTGFMLRGTYGLQSSSETICDSNTLSPNTWYFAALTYDGSWLRLYADGVQVASQPEGGNAGSSTAEFIGASPSLSDVFNGMIANVQFYKAALSAAQVSQMYSEGVFGAPLPAESLASWWPLDGDANDYLGNSTGYPVDLSYRFSGYESGGLRNAFQISKSSAILPISTYAAEFTRQVNNIEVSAPQVNTNNNGYNTASFWMYWNGGAGEAPFWFQNYQLLISNSGECFGFTRDNGANIYGISTGDGDHVAPVLGNRWVHVTAVFYNGPYFDNSTLYIDGIRQSLAMCAGQPGGGSAATTFRIGGEPTAFGFEGDMADFQLYNTELSSAQAAALYREGIAGLPLSGSGLVSWLPLDGNANDYSGNLNNGIQTAVNYTYVAALYNAGILSWK